MPQQCLLDYPIYHTIIIHYYLEMLTHTHTQNTKNIFCVYDFSWQCLFKCIFSYTFFPNITVPEFFRLHTIQLFCLSCNKYILMHIVFDC